ncbi:Fe transport outer membrane receptor protein [Alcanivorax nanhaiticus]|uniref:Fe transport outer membrane receptor protein n=1 Tax=Alcanivorax nanhaiticus TaxID=1177154 RepID=A0A095UNX4_9GAMM|nr:Fe transport outer membrane receptor protein [Alcanivorax nanhaiticus]
MPRFRLIGLPISMLTLAISPLALAEEANELGTITVSATRSNSEVGKTPQKITVISKEDIEQQLRMTSDQSQVLSNLIPSYTPSRQKLTNAGETFRGRAPLFLIDGIPQSNPLRDGSRDGYTIDLSMVERIEVIHGASAEHGLGATGGIINFVTRRPESGTVNQHIGVQATSPTNDIHSDSLSYKVDYRVDGIAGNVDYLLGVSYVDRGMFYDAEGDYIGVDGTQGDIMDSQSGDVFLKLGYWFNDEQNIELSVNRFELEGNHDYVAVYPQDGWANGISTKSKKGSPEGDAPMNEVTTAGLTYTHSNLAGNHFTAQLYSQTFKGRYGGGTFDTFQYTPGLLEEDRIYDQSQNESDKIGGKLTLTRDGMLDNHLKLTTGLDVLQDETTQILAQTGREWVPETQFRNIAPFLQAEVQPMQQLTLSAGVRYEYAKLNVDDFTTLASYGSKQVEGGNPDFDETLINYGVVFQATENAQLFANYSEGFGMPDVGRVLRGINQDNQSVEDFLDLQPIVTDNTEIGVRLHNGSAHFEISHFSSDSDLGQRLQNNGGIFEVSRERTEIQGIEADAGWQLNASHFLNASYVHTSGKFDSDEDGSVDTRLDGRNIAPDSIQLRWQANWTSKLDTQLQGTHYFNKDFEGDTNDFTAYQLVDLSLGYTLPKGQITAGIENLLNEDYFTYFSQTATTRDDQNFKGRGRTFTLGYNLDF